MRRLRALVPGLLPLALGVALVDAACNEEGSQVPASTPTPDAGPSVDATTIVDAPWDHVRAPYDGASPGATTRVPVTAELVSARVDVQELMFAAGEMQTSGEPFARDFAGRNLAYYDRTYLPTDQYLVSNGDDPTPVTDLFGFSTAVESYEYSKYHMNMVVQQTGAGVSLADGPVVAKLPLPPLVDGGVPPLFTTASWRLRGHTTSLFYASGSDIGQYTVLPPPIDNPKNYLGFGGIFPVFAPYKSFEPSMQPQLSVVRSCAGGGGYGGVPSLGQMVPEYECEYNSLRLLQPAQQTERVLVPAVLGLASWKQALWAIDFTSRIHDAGANPVNAVAEKDLRDVGKPNNTVMATDPPGAAIGTYIGSNPLEGVWGLLMLTGMDNLAEWLVASLTTTDGATLGGFASKHDALAYDYASPLRWFPAAIDVAVDFGQAFPPVTSLAIKDAQSRSEDLAGLLLGNALFFAMTDARNAGIGGQLGLRAAFDGDPFPADDGAPDGSETAHDRALSVLRVAFVNLDRMHGDPALGVLADTATVTAGKATPGGTVTTTSLAHALIALRQTVLSLNAAITQYGSADADPSGDAKGILNALPIHPPGGGTPTFSGRVRDVFLKNAAFVHDVLTKADGTVANSAAVASGKATPAAGPATLETQAAAARALTEAFLVSKDESYRERARAVVRRLAAQFYSAPARMYRGVEGGKDEVHMTPERFAWLQSALREAYKVLSIEGDPALGRIVLEDRIARINKLFLNGWDDLDGNKVVDATRECLKARLQMAEQSLTGELGRDELSRPAADRDNDCVTELAHAQKASAMASEVFFHAP